MWLPALELANKTNRDRFVSLEFVENNSQKNFINDANVLKDWIKYIRSKQNKKLSQLNKKILLVGMKSCDCKSIGINLAAILGLPFYDQQTEMRRLSCNLIEEELPLSKVFATYGVKHYQELEKKALHNLIAKLMIEDCVIASDCLASVVKEHSEELLKNCIVVFVDVSENTLQNSLLNGDILNLHLLQLFESQQTVEESLNKLLNTQLPLYRQMADIICHCESSSTDSVAVDIGIELRKATDDN
jgi:shikimate kinase